MDVVFVAHHILVGSYPSYSLLTKCLFTVTEDTHTLIKHPSRLPIVKNVELGGPNPPIANLEVEPVTVAISVDIVLKEQVVLSFTDLTNEGQIARLKPGIKYKVPIHNIRFSLHGEVTYG